MEISERIAKIIDSEGLTASAFADKVDTQRSNISLILSGRHRPGLDLLQKILSAFPQYNTDWLIMGRGEIYRQPVQTSIFDIIGDDGEPVAGNIAVTEPAARGSEEAENMAQNANNGLVTPEIPQTQAVENLTVANAQNPTGKTEPAAKDNLTSVLAHAAQHRAEVKQVVILYSDNTFEAYNRQ